MPCAHDHTSSRRAVAGCNTAQPPAVQCTTYLKSDRATLCYCCTHVHVCSKPYHQSSCGIAHHLRAALPPNVDLFSPLHSMRRRVACGLKPTRCLITSIHPIDPPPFLFIPTQPLNHRRRPQATMARTAAFVSRRRRQAVCRTSRRDWRPRWPMSE